MAHAGWRIITLLSNQLFYVGMQQKLTENLHKLIMLQAHFNRLRFVFFWIISWTIYNISLQTIAWSQWWVIHFPIPSMKMSFAIDPDEFSEPNI